MFFKNTQTNTILQHYFKYTCKFNKTNYSYSKPSLGKMYFETHKIPGVGFLKT